MINYLKGDATYPQGGGIQIIPHICNDQGGWGKGFVTAISKRWLLPEKIYRAWFKSKSSGKGGIWYNNGIDTQPCYVGPSFGACMFVRVEEDITIVNMVCQAGYYRQGSNNPAVDYLQLQECLKEVQEYADMRRTENYIEVREGKASSKTVSIHMPKIGTGLAGGKWEVIEDIINRTLSLKGENVFIYEL